MKVKCQIYKKRYILVADPLSSQKALVVQRNINKNNYQLNSADPKHPLLQKCWLIDAAAVNQLFVFSFSVLLLCFFVKYVFVFFALEVIQCCAQEKFALCGQ